MSHLISVVCPCGKTFEVTKARHEAGRGRRCSKACQYRYATRPSGLAYTLTKENSGRFKPGRTPWNAGTKGVMQAWNKGIAGPSGDQHPQWLGEDVTYGTLHNWVSRNKEKTGVCAECGKRGRTDWANISYEYRRDLDDWQELCHRCHLRGDRQAGEWGTAAEVFPGYGKRVSA